MLNIIIGIVFIGGGLSGEFVLKGTQSSGGIIFVGAILVIWGFMSLGKGSDDY